MKLYVGNLGFMMTDVQLQALFAENGSVNSAKVIRDHDSAQGRGFGFVEMPDAGGTASHRVIEWKDHRRPGTHR